MSYPTIRGFYESRWRRIQKNSAVSASGAADEEDVSDALER
jgi:hypothetical protein